MNKPIIKKNIHEYIIIAMLGFILLTIYLVNVKNIVSIWEIGDEAGYLSNAAYFAGNIWEDTREALSYFGYGYSLFLTPLFFFCKSGKTLIQGAILTNVLFVILTYFVQIKLMSEIFKECKKKYISIIAFSINLYPYILSSSMKVICESALTFHYWLLALTIYQSLKHKKKYAFFLLGIETAFIFYIHTRAIIVIAVIGIILLFLLYKKHIVLREMIIFSVSFIVIWGLGYLLKKHLISTAYLGLEANNPILSKNIITLNYITDRIRWLFLPENFKLYFFSFVGKTFYLFSSTIGLIMIGFIFIIKYLFSSPTETIDEIPKKIVLFYFLGTFLLMFSASCVSGTGMSDMYTSYFYGRYYEYTIGGIAFVGIYCLQNGESKIKINSIAIVVAMILGLLTKELSVYFEKSNTFVDTARTAGFAYSASKQFDFHEFINFQITINFILGVIILIMYMSKVRKYIPVVFLIGFLLNDKECINVINKANEIHKLESEMARYINEKSGDEYVYFMNSEKRKHSSYFSVMQIMIKDKELVLTDKEAIVEAKNKMYILCYYKTPESQFLNDLGDLIIGNNTFELYSINN